MSPPALPPRQGTVDADGVPDEPPPAYEPTPASNQQTLEYGPTRPFQPPPGPPPPQQQQQPYFTASSAPPSSFAPPPQHPSLSPGLSPPQFPFWNGASLTPSQTGFVDRPSRPLDSHPTGNYAPHASTSYSPYQAPQNQHFHSPSFSQHPPPPLPPRSTAPPAESQYAPTTVATPGQPLLNGGSLLVYPVNQKLCPKCSNTGYKPFELYTGYRGDDPSHPCRTCWKKHSRPFSGPLALSCTSSTHASIPPNYQRPLRLFQTPADRPPMQQQPIITVSNQRHMSLNPNTLVVRPGDPRMGGALCRRCGGDGLMMGPFFIDEVTCDMCRGAGRVFM